MTRRGLLCFVGLGIAWGIPYLLIKVAVRELSPSQLVLVRTALAAALLLPLAAGRGALRPLLPVWRPVVAFTVVEIAVPWVALGSAEQSLPSSTTGLLIAAVPLVGVGIALVTGSSERMPPLAWVGLGLGIAGVAALLGLDVGGSDPAPLAELAVTIVGYAVGPVILARYLADVPGLGVSAAALTVSALAYLPIVAFGAGLPNPWPSAEVGLSVVLLATVCTAAAFLMLFALVAEIGPVRATTITYVNPAVAVAAGALLLDEPVTGWTVLGFVLVVAGSYLVNRRPRRSAPSDLPQAATEPAAAPLG